MHRDRRLWEIDILENSKYVNLNAPEEELKEQVIIKHKTNSEKIESI